jgi:hypothetical protein
MARTWQYRTIALTHGTMGFSKGKINRTTLEAELATAGEEGWELVHFWPDTSLHQEKDGHLLISSEPATRRIRAEVGAEVEPPSPVW